MKKASLKAIAEKMKSLDLCMLVTQDGRGSLHSRPMSNNGEVEYDGDSWFFTYEDTHKVKQIEADPKVSLIFQTPKAMFIECYGHASIIRQRSMMEEKWMDELNMWFPQGLDTPGICMLKVSASRVRFWHNEESGEYKA
ncbi:MAG: pyridoxamine 5'-phosphate oxidase [Sphingobacteriales bacterium]|nr:MAG: pyridoxamine 5'-phosphate oxidase [Sphingobacteriales bacterium]